MEEFNPTDPDDQFSVVATDVAGQLEELAALDPAEAPELARKVAETLATQLDDLDAT